MNHQVKSKSSSPNQMHSMHSHKNLIVIKTYQILTSGKMLQIEILIPDLNGLSEEIGVVFLTVIEEAI